MRGKTTSQQPTIKPNNTRPTKSSGRNLSSRPRVSIRWADIPNQLLRDAICAVCDEGAALLLGTTTDGGALSIKVFDGDSKVAEYPHSVEDTEEVLRWLVTMFSSD